MIRPLANDETRAGASAGITSSGEPGVDAPGSAGQRTNRPVRPWQAACGALFLYLLLALAVLSPLAASAMPQSPAQDLANHVSGIIEARNALAEGQFPIRVAPHQHNGERYPIFQFYGNLPYTAGGLLYLATGRSPYLIWKLLVTLSLVGGGFFTYRCGRVLARQTLPAVMAGAIFLTAPYMLTDIHGRFAFPEMVSFALLPAVFFYALRCFASPRLGPVLCSAVSWSFLALSHNITFLYGSGFFGLYFLSSLSLTRTSGRRLLRLGAAYALGLALTAWYIAPQAELVPHLVISRLNIPVGASAWLTRLGVLLAPTVVPPVPLPTVLIDDPMHFGLQPGWLILAAAALSLYYLRQPPRDLGVTRARVTRLLGLLALTLFLVWTPFDFWDHLPRVFGYVQFSYRLLMFVVLWGSVLSAYALARFFQGSMRFEHLVVCLLILGTFTAPYLSPHKASQQVSLEKEVASPDMGRGGATTVYLLAPDVLAQRAGPSSPGGRKRVLAAGEVQTVIRPGQQPLYRAQVTRPGLVQLPVLFYPGLLHVDVDGRPVSYQRLDRLVALELGPGEHWLAVRFAGVEWANQVSLAGWIGLLTAGLFLGFKWLRRSTAGEGRC